MKYNKAISLFFPAGVSKTTAEISVPINVKTIHIKSISLVNGTIPTVAEYLFLFSDLTQNSPCGVVFNDSTYPYSTGNDIEYVLQNPQPIGGTYNFSLTTMNTLTPYVAPANGTAIGLIIEFNDEKERI